VAWGEKSTRAVSETHVTEQKKLVDNKELTYYASTDFCMCLNLEAQTFPAELSAEYKIHGENGLIASNDAVWEACLGHT